MKIDDAVLSRMSRFLDYAARRQKVITSNLANAETPGYKAQDVLGHDGNNVDLEKELVDLSENVLKFSVVGRLLQLKLQLIKSGIKEGRG
ncbi:MAG: flagellar basal body protein [Acidobacteriota bacterium]